MNTMHRKRAQLFASILGVAVFIPLLAPSASASTSDGLFQIKAVNSEEAEFEAIAGSTGLIAGPGEVIPPDTVDSFSCGPLKVYITQEMIDFSKANEDLYADGRASEMIAHPDGWKFIASYRDGAFSPGYPTDGTLTPLFKLGEDLDMTSGTVNYLKQGPNCALTDNRVGPSANATYSFTETMVEGQPYYIEGRWISEENEIRKAVVSGSDSVTRYTASDIYPSHISLGDLITVIDVRPTQVVDGVYRIRHTIQDETINYSFRSPANTSALRTNGPTVITVVKATGKIIALSYTDSSGVERPISPLKGTTNAEIIANYNVVSGQSWDGSLPTLDGYDLTIPFTADPN